MRGYRDPIGMPTIVGISTYFHDSACCVLRDGWLVAAAEEERFTRVKHDRRLPLHAFEWCLRQSGVSIADVDCVGYYEWPDRKLERQLSQVWPHVTKERCLRLWSSMRRPTDEIRNSLGYDGEIVFGDHHLSHAASAFYFSGYRDAAILTIDAVGEWATTGP
jgi:carbamoyltransferase